MTKGFAVKHILLAFLLIFSSITFANKFSLYNIDKNVISKDIYKYQISFKYAANNDLYILINQGKILKNNLLAGNKNNIICYKKKFSCIRHIATNASLFLHLEFKHAIYFAQNIHKLNSKLFYIENNDIAYIFISKNNLTLNQQFHLMAKNNTTNTIAIIALPKYYLSILTKKIFADLTLADIIQKSAFSSIHNANVNYSLIKHNNSEKLLKKTYSFAVENSDEGFLYLIPEKENFIKNDHCNVLGNYNFSISKNNSKITKKIIFCQNKKHATINFVTKSDFIGVPNITKHNSQQLPLLKKLGQQLTTPTIEKIDSLFKLQELANFVFAQNNLNLKTTTANKKIFKKISNKILTRSCKNLQTLNQSSAILDILFKLSSINIIQLLDYNFCIHSVNRWIVKNNYLNSFNQNNIKINDLLVQANIFAKQFLITNKLNATNSIFNKSILLYNDLLKNININIKDIIQNYDELLTLFKNSKLHKFSHKIAGMSDEINLWFTQQLLAHNNSEIIAKINNLYFNKNYYWLLNPNNVSNDPSNCGENIEHSMCMLLKYHTLPLQINIARTKKYLQTNSTAKLLNSEYLDKKATTIPKINLSENQDNANNDHYLISIENNFQAQRATSLLSTNPVYTPTSGTSQNSLLSMPANLHTSQVSSIPKICSTCKEIYGISFDSNNKNASATNTGNSITVNLPHAVWTKTYGNIRTTSCLGYAIYYTCYDINNPNSKYSCSTKSTQKVYDVQIAPNSAKSINYNIPGNSLSKGAVFVIFNKNISNANEVKNLNQTGIASTFNTSGFVWNPSISNFSTSSYPTIKFNVNYAKKYGDINNKRYQGVNCKSDGNDPNINCSYTLYVYDEKGQQYNKQLSTPATSIPVSVIVNPNENYNANICSNLSTNTLPTQNLKYANCIFIKMENKVTNTTMVQAISNSIPSYSPKISKFNNDYVIADNTELKAYISQPTIEISSINNYPAIPSENSKISTANLYVANNNKPIINGTDVGKEFNISANNGQAYFAKFILNDYDFNPTNNATISVYQKLNLSSISPLSSLNITDLKFTPTYNHDTQNQGKAIAKVIWSCLIPNTVAGTTTKLANCNKVNISALKGTSGNTTSINVGGCQNAATGNCSISNLTYLNNPKESYKINVQLLTGTQKINNIFPWQIILKPPSQMPTIASLTTCDGEKNQSFANPNDQTQHPSFFVQIDSNSTNIKNLEKIYIYDLAINNKPAFGPQKICPLATPLVPVSNQAATTCKNTKKHITYYLTSKQITGVLKKTSSYKMNFVICYNKGSSNIMGKYTATCKVKLNGLTREFNTCTLQAVQTNVSVNACTCPPQ